MTYKEYQQKAKRTCSDLSSDKLNLSHMVLGIHSEYSEQIDAVLKKDYANLVEEFADEMWYIANYCTFRNYDLQKLWENRHESSEVMEESSLYLYSISLLQDLVKKYVAYNKPISREKEELYLKAILLSLDIDIHEASLTETDLLLGLERNIEKLKVRFPDKFDEFLANNRDLETERKKLEGK